MKAQWTIAGVFFIGSMIGWYRIPNEAPARPIAARSQIEAFGTALSAYQKDTDEYPTVEQGLQALRKCPQGVNGWQGPYLPKDIPNDPWGRPYVYRYPGSQGDRPDVQTLGPK